MKVSAAVLAVFILFLAVVPASAQQADPFAATNARLREIVASAACKGSMPTIQIARYHWVYTYCGSEVRINGEAFAGQYADWSELEKSLFHQFLSKIIQDLRVTFEGTAIHGTSVEANPAARAVLEVGKGGTLVLAAAVGFLVQEFKGFLDRNPNLRLVTLIVANAIESWATGTWVGFPGVTQAKPTYIEFVIHRW